MEKKETPNLRDRPNRRLRFHSVHPASLGRFTAPRLETHTVARLIQ